MFGDVTERLCASSTANCLGTRSNFCCDNENLCNGTVTISKGWGWLTVIMATVTIVTWLRSGHYLDT